MSSPRQKSGFSYIELLIGMVVVLTLYAVMFAPSEVAVRRQKFARCAENLRKLHLALTLYANEHGDAYPAVPDAQKSGQPLGLLVPTYTADTSFFTCADGGGYAYAMGLKKSDTAWLLADRLESTQPITPGLPLFPQRGNHAGYGGNMLFTDGHVEQLGPNAPRALPLPAHAKALNP